MQESHNESQTLFSAGSDCQWIATNLETIVDQVIRHTMLLEPERWLESIKGLVDAKINHLSVPKEESPRTTSGKDVNLMYGLRKSLGTNRLLRTH